MPHELADAVLQRSGDLFQRQMKLDFTASFSSFGTESADRFLAVDLVSSLYSYSDSPFFGKQTPFRGCFSLGRRVAAFYDLTDILHPVPVEERIVQKPIIREKIVPRYVIKYQPSSDSTGARSTLPARRPIIIIKEQVVRFPQVALLCEMKVRFYL